MELKDLVGEHVLTGVDFGIRPRDEARGDFEDANTIAFVLDDRVYVVTEDQNDGYRSSMREIEQVDAVVANTFAPCRVVGRHRTQTDARYSSQVDDVLELIDVVTGQIVIEVGTDNTDDYYPCYVANFIPEHMASNVKLKMETGR